MKDRINDRLPLYTWRFTPDLLDSKDHLGFEKVALLQLSRLKHENTTLKAELTAIEKNGWQEGRSFEIKRMEKDLERSNEYIHLRELELEQIKGRVSKAVNIFTDHFSYIYEDYSKEYISQDQLKSYLLAYQKFIEESDGLSLTQYPALKKICEAIDKFLLNTPVTNQ